VDDAQDTPPAEGAGSIVAEEKALRLIGLGVRARNAVVGVERVREAAKHDTLWLAAVASDASGHSQEKVRPLLAAKRVRVLEFSLAALGHAVGREGAAAVGVTDPHLARGILMALGIAQGDVESAPERARGGSRSAGRARGRRRTRRMD